MNFYIDERIVNAYYNTTKKYIIVEGGRGSGKSLQLGALCILTAMKNPNARILAVRGTQNKISESSLQIIKDVIDMMGVASYFNITEHTLSCKNGSTFLFYGAKSYLSFKSLQGINLVWIDEATELSKIAWDVLIPTIREDNSRFLISFNPEFETDDVYNSFITHKRDSAIVIQMIYTDNPFFPKTLRLEMEYDKANNYNKYLHIWEGQLIKETEGALWTMELIKYLADDIVDNFSINDLERIIVAVDPSVTSNLTSDSCGIIIVGKYKDKDRYIVLDDLTRIATPNEWADLAILSYDKYKADRIVAEVNQGGDLVQTIIQNKRKNISYKGVHASRGKIVRAEPILALYEQGKVDHIRKFTNLEYEMVTFSGISTDKSPNSLDALVWGLTFLSSKTKKNLPNGMVSVSANKLKF